MAVITWWMLTCAVGLLGGSEGVRRGTSPSLLGGVLAGLGLRDYERDVTEQDPRSRCSNLSGPFRTFDGTCNNADNLGAANTPLARLLPPVYQDGVEEPRTRGRNGRPLRGARRISQLVFPDTSRRGLNTLLLMQWGQFLDHDMTLMPLPTERVREEGGEPIICCGRDRLGLASPQPEDCFPITFSRDPGFLGSCMEFVRTIPATRRNPRNRREPREQLNALTAFIDASAVYGSSTEEEEELREANGRGYLLKSERSSQGPLLPRTDRGICARERDDPPNTPVCFLAGDERVNEQPDLATIHTIFLRLHNVIASRMAAATPRASLSSFNSTVFQSARRVVGAIVQRVMFGEWLPIILGDRVMRRVGLSVARRSDYDPSVDPRILNEFSTAAYRLGHSLVPRFLPTPSPNLRDQRIRLRDHFLRPRVVRQRFTALALGLVVSNTSITAREQSQSLDSFISRELSRHLFEPAGQRGRGLDLMSLNIQRGRDHGLQPYNAYRQFFGLENVTSFTDSRLGRNGARGIFSRLYDSVDDIDLFVGGLSEPANGEGGQLGETFTAIVAEQMRRLKFGDRFFFTHRARGNVGFNDDQLSQLQRVTAALVMCLGVPRLSEVQRNAFLVASDSNPPVPCRRVRRDVINVRDFILEDQ